MRIAAVSDLHGNLPEIPQCDLLILAGDLCPDRLPGSLWARQDPTIQSRWLKRDFHWWLNAQRGRYTRILATWGNHDFIGQATEFAMPDFPIMFAVDELVEYKGITFWMSPWTCQNDLRLKWAFMADDESLARRFDAIPPGVDVLVSHSPAYGYGDDPRVPILTGGGDVHLGSKSLLSAVERVKPRALICGHIHGGYGQFELPYTAEKFNNGNGGQFQVGHTDIYNVALVNEAYQPIHPVTIIDL